MTDTRCPHIGTILVAGRPVGELRCELADGHDGPPLMWNPDGPTPHRATLLWVDELPVTLEAPEDGIEVDVPMEDVPVHALVDRGFTPELDPRASWRGGIVPPVGWWCSREAGHDVPCAARPGTHPPAFDEAGNLDDLH